MKEPEKFVWVNARTNELQNCRQVAAVNTIMFQEDLGPTVVFQLGELPSNECLLLQLATTRRNESFCFSWSTLHAIPEPDRKIWILVPCSAAVLDNVHPQLSEATARLTRHSNLRRTRLGSTVELKSCLHTLHQV